MATIIVKDAKTGSNMIIEHSIPVPAYDIGYTVGFKDQHNFTKEVEGLITGYQIVAFDLPGGIEYQIFYTINEGEHEVDEDSIDWFIE